ncbi:3-methyl-2-oxobutanoate hydroxymethyltransferase [Helicobacter turcicus]|uniref:3-methyl-2-oxobutanoate hydroxymethyltransferase n=1 Tax=Helicobacter turcicus TaxID=2867412 RepID=A0ABS7JPY3_9HELI|nr:3-methyl-2-oxobutanoate hydroxymethyltransferase [Helicobacter turcicus]MBX7491423.1 3-methyl-2-oxobutanoate hydroxymethyltransferase [Helicobacter turcicus]MBX7546290.1 3-methyl-2-oxobutanoate hydroxymethyltransferase [Helicobacter turcicus]
MSMQTRKKHITTTEILKKKNTEKITMLTAYDALFAKIFDGEVDMLLVGDSLNMSFFGESDTLSATLEQMIYHTKAVCNGAKTSLVVCDLPFGSTICEQIALEAALRVFKETKAQAVKLEGGAEIAQIIKHLTQNGIAVVGHIGLKPQFMRLEGGYKVKGKQESELESLLKDARALEEAGAFCFVLEGVPSEVGKKIAQSVGIPVIGIGSGVDVDGQVLVWSDAFGFFEDFKPKFVRQYLKGAELIRDALKEYAKDVKNGDFPNVSESY